MKKCFKCEIEKPLTEFYKHKAMSDGHLNKCKSCTKDDAAKHREDNLEKIKEYDRNRPNAKERNEQNKANYKKGMKDPEYRNRLAESRKRSAEKHFEKRAANWTTSNAIRDGKLIRQPCEVCGDLKVDAHHDDYSKPLDVRWLCRPHHAVHHKNMREIERKK